MTEEHAQTLRDLDEAVTALAAAYERLREERDRYRAALASYADEARWERVAGRHYRRLLAGYVDGWTVARAALADVDAP